MQEPFDIRKTDPRRQLAAEELRPVVIVSADSHVGLGLDPSYRQYVDPQYREAFDEAWPASVASMQAICDATGYPFQDDTLEVIDGRSAYRTGGELAFFDPVRRLRECEREGVVAELLHPQGFVGPVPFFDLHSTRCSDELRAAGARAHNRFLVDFCSEAPERLLGVPCIYPWPDFEAAARDLEAARAAGMRAFYPPQQAGVEGDLPAFYDRSWDPLWAAAQDTGMVVHIHAGWGYPQGAVRDMMRQTREYAERLRREAKTDAERELVSELSVGFDLKISERRPLWQLMLGGVFDRFPRLKVAWVEVHGDWVPPTLAYLEQRFDDGSLPLKKRPSDYWRDHCAVGGSLMRYGDVEARHALGLEKLMFGTDFPHQEGTWPNTWDWIRATMGSIPRDEARRILGENAIDFYGLDRPHLEKLATRIGPYPMELFGEHRVDPRILENFEIRGGIGKQPNYNEQVLADFLAGDIKGALTSR